MAQPLLRITLVRSAHGYESDQMDTARALGLRRLHQSVVREDTPSLRGLVRKITHLVVTETVSGQEITPTFRRHRRPGVASAPRSAAQQPSLAKPPAPVKRQAAKAEVSSKVAESPAAEPSRPAAHRSRAPAKTAAQGAPKQPARAKTAKAPAKAPVKAPTKTPAKAAKSPKASPTSKSGREPKAK